jgi:hypothetical protein
MCFVRFSLPTAFITLNSVNNVTFVMVKCGVFFLGATGSKGQYVILIVYGSCKTHINSYFIM